jgi:hypothetical protein
MIKSSVVVWYFLLICIGWADHAHEYMRVQGSSVMYFDKLPRLEIPKIKSVEDSVSTELDLEGVKKSVFDLTVYSENSQGAVDISSTASAYAVQIGTQICLAGCYHVFSQFVDSPSKFAILIQDSEGQWFHIKSFMGVCCKSDFVIMEPSKVLSSALFVASNSPKPLDNLLTCGRLGRHSGVFRRGELWKIEETNLFTNLAATRGTSGSPVLNERGELVGMITQVVPVLRESGLYSGDHFAELVITQCRRLPIR